MKQFGHLFTYESQPYSGDYHDCVALVQFGTIAAGDKFERAWIAVIDSQPHLYLVDKDNHTVSVKLDVSLHTQEFEVVDRLVYVAGPWFHPGQEERLRGVIDALKRHGFNVFSPKDEILFEAGKTTPEEVLLSNTHAILKSQFMLCITDGKDVGTMFEAGYAHAAGIPVLYFWEEGLAAMDKGAKFNLMLAATGRVACGWHELDALLADGDFSTVISIPDDRIE